MNKLKQSMRCRVLVCLIAASAALQSAMAEPAEMSAGVTLGSDSLFRGVSETLGGAAIQAYADLTFDSGLYGYVWASNVDFVPDNEPDDGARIEIDVALGYAADLSDQWSVDIMLVRYTFPSTVVDADYAELIATMWLDEQYSATIGYSDDVFGTDASGFYAAVGTSHELPMELTLSTELGYYDLDDAYESDYSFAGVRLSRPVGPLSVSLAYYDTFGDADEIFYRQAVGSRIVLSLDFELLN